MTNKDMPAGILLKRRGRLRVPAPARFEFDPGQRLELRQGAVQPRSLLGMSDPVQQIAKPLDNRSLEDGASATSFSESILSPRSASTVVMASIEPTLWA
jgi:hypothetical protein